MHRPPNLDVTFSFTRIHCHDEGDGPGAAEPYLWTIFFKIDGSNINQKGATFRGSADFHFGKGSHGNLIFDADEGDDLFVPRDVGEWSTTLQAIPVSDENGNKIWVPGILVGVAVLMEEDSVNDDSVEVGRQALARFIQEGVDAAIMKIDLKQLAADAARANTTLEAAAEAFLITTLEALEDGAGAVVSQAIEADMGAIASVWAWMDKDERLGGSSFTFDQRKLSKRLHSPFSKRWKPDDVVGDRDTLGDFGEWEIFGAVNASVRPMIVTPPKSEELRISCVTTGRNNRTGRQRIWYLGGIDGDAPFYLSYREVMRMIGRGHVFFVEDKNGDRADVGLFYHPGSQIPYLATHPDRSRENNLLALPSASAFFHDLDL
jgi:hypothetical protein